jgi:hypothetical protein
LDKRKIYFDAGSLEKAKAHLKKAWDLSEGRAFAGEPKNIAIFF